MQSCAVSSDGRVYCFGTNHGLSKNLGVESQLTWQDQDANIVQGAIHSHLDGAPYRRVRSGARFSCGQTQPGTWACWGSNQGGVIHPGDFGMGVSGIADQPREVPARN
ncbi:MAG TPA: hypothetical protein DEB46_14230 [Myxococcales bacterium]|nr:hypothetical protein [Myxococcales bacterium]